ncbi:carboxypeptidase regulatory-like domain-containing protein [Sandaracinus amylolyticus]|uniref:carboxypeptidase regulatory-like domain-containing protein n=1 Tax=Sandaracinus amylolyticus TaxID=927083 RepID=UPI001F3A71B7|nr:carboxypeptidase regulatory-like domain-containing protein [Sandaracinus amylolyticus]
MPSAPVGPRPARGDRELAGRVVDPEGRGVPEARVQAVREDVDGDVMREVRSGADGAFVLSELPTGRWTLRASASGFGASATVRDVPGSSEALVLTIAPVARVAGQVMGIDGAPVSGAEIVLAGSGVWPARTMQTGADGRFVLEDVPPGVYEVQAHASTGAAPPRRGLVIEAGGRAYLTFHLEPGATMVGQVIDGETDAPIAGAQIVVAEGELAIAPRALRSNGEGAFRVAGLASGDHHVTVHAEGYVPVVGARWTPGEPLRLTMERGAVLSGIVLDARRRPVEGARLEVLGESGDRQPIAMDGASVAFRAEVFRAHEQALGAGPPASLGALEVTSDVPPIPLAPAAYEAPVELASTSAPAAPRMGAIASGFVTASDGTFRIEGVPPGHVQLVARKAGFAPGSSERVWVGAGRERDRIEIVLEPSGRIEGEVVDERGDEVASAMIEHRSDAEPWPRVTVSDASGRFVLEDVAGAVTIRANVAGRAPVQVRVDVSAGGRERVRVVLPAPGPSIEGRTVDERGREVASVQVRVESMAPGESAPRVVFSDERGRFAIDDAPPGPWRVSADHADYAQGDPVDLDTIEGELRVVVRAGANVRGRVVDAMSGEAIEGASIVIERAEGPPLSRDTRSDAEGSFVIPRAVPASYVATVSAPGFAAWRGEIAVSATRGGEIELDAIELTPGARLEGEVVDALGAVVRGASVSVDGDPARATRTDAHGRFVLDGLGEGSFVILAAHPAAGEVTRTIQVRAMRDPSAIVMRLPQRYDPDEAASERAIRRGVAIEVEDGDGVVRVSSASGRAGQAGLRAGDVLLAIDGELVEHAEDAERLLRGADGVSAVLDLEREGEPFRVRVAREAW